MMKKFVFPTVVAMETRKVTISVIIATAAIWKNALLNT